MWGKGLCACDVTSTSQSVTPNTFRTSRGISECSYESDGSTGQVRIVCRSAFWFCAKRERGGRLNSGRENWPHVPYANMPYKNNELLLRYSSRTRTLLCEFWGWRSHLGWGCCQSGSWTCGSGCNPILSPIDGASWPKRTEAYTTFRFSWGRRDFCAHIDNKHSSSFSTVFWVFFFLLKLQKRVQRFKRWTWSIDS